MPQRSLSDYHRRYHAIIASDAAPIDRDMALSALMTQMERTYHIPLLYNERWVRGNAEIYAVYRLIADSRTTL